MTWLDWIVLVVVLLFAVRGLLRGTIAQTFSILGVVGGLWAAGWVSQWVGEHWTGARPAVVFLVLRWLVAALAGTAVAALFQWWGEKIGGVVKSGPLGFLDRAGGWGVGAVIGLVVVTFAIMAMVLVTWSPVNRPALQMKLAGPLMAGARFVCALGEPTIPGSTWLMHRFSSAHRRIERLEESRASGAAHDARNGRR